MNDDAQSTASRYRLLEQTGEVFAAELFRGERLGVEGFAKQVTVWRVKADLCSDPTAEKVLLADLKRLGELSVWSICQVLDVWRRPKGLSFAAEQVAGLSLADLIQRVATRGERMPLPALLSIGLEVARALERAHQDPGPAGPVVHGDLRPEHVLVDLSGNVKLTGFGFARFLPAVSPDGIWATWRNRLYQPPERCTMGSQDPRVDIHALGVVLLEAATGKPPHGTTDPAQLLERAQAGEELPESSRLGLPESLAKVLARAVAARPEDRHETMEDLASDLHRVMVAEHGRAPGAAPIREALAALDSTGDDAWAERPSTTRALARTRQLTVTRDIGPARRSTGQEPLVGRLDVLDQVESTLASVTEGEGRVLLLTGEPGMGRTRLLDEVRRRVAAPGTDVVWLGVSVHRDEHEVRYSGVLRFLAAAAGLPPTAELVHLVDRLDRLRAFGLDAEMLSTIRSLLGGPGAAAPERAGALLSQAAIQCVARMCWEKPTLLSVDDVHLLDVASVECLAELWEHALALPTTALLTAPEGTTFPWPNLTPVVVRLGPLAAADCEVLIRSRQEEAQQVDAALLDAVIRESGGNPSRVLETLDLLEEEGHLRVEDGVLRRDAGSRPGLPVLEDAVRVRLRRLDPSMAKVVAAAALAEQPLPPRILAQAAEVELYDLEAALPELQDLERLLVTRPDGLDVPSQRLRDAVRRCAAPEALDTLRRRLAWVMLRAWDDPPCAISDQAARLLEEGGEPDKAVRALMDAARRQGARGDQRGSTERYGRAFGLALEKASLPPDVMLELGLATGRAALPSLDLALAEQALLRAVAEADAQDNPRAGAEARVLLSRVHARQARQDEAAARAQEAIPLAERSGHRILLAQAYAAIAESMQHRGQYGPDWPYVQNALRIAEEAGELLKVGEYLQLAVMHAVGVGQFEEPYQYLERGRAIAKASGDPNVTCQMLKAEALLHAFMGDNEAGLKTNLEGIARARRHGLTEVELVMLHNAGDNQLNLGRVSEALYCFNESLRRARMARFDRLCEINEMFVGYIEAARLGSASGLDRLRAAIETGKKNGRIWNLAQGLSLLGRALLERGDREASIPVLEEAVQLAETSGVRWFIDEANHWLNMARFGNDNEAPTDP